MNRDKSNNEWILLFRFVGRAEVIRLVRTTSNLIIPCQRSLKSITIRAVPSECRTIKLLRAIINNNFTRTFSIQLLKHFLDINNLFIYLLLCPRPLSTCKALCSYHSLLNCLKLNCPPPLEWNCQPNKLHPLAIFLLLKYCINSPVPQFPLCCTNWTEEFHSYGSWDISTTTQLTSSPGPCVHIHSTYLMVAFNYRNWL